MRIGFAAFVGIFAGVGSLGACGLDLGSTPVTDVEAGAFDSGGPSPERDTGVVDPPGGDASQPDANPWVEPAPRCDADPTLTGKAFPRRTTPFVIDGSLADWSATERWESIALPYSSFEPTVGIPCAEFAARWDEDALYVAMRVADPMPPGGPDDATQLWLNDAVEVFVGPSGLMGSEGIYTPSDSQVLVDRNGVALRKTGTAMMGSVTNYLASRPPIEWVTRKTSWGYITEFKINRSVWGVTTPLQPGASMRFMAAFDNALQDRSNKAYYLWNRPTGINVCSTAAPTGYCCVDDDQGGAYCNTQLFQSVTLQ